MSVVPANSSGSRASASATSVPMPALAPVARAVRPLNFISIALFSRLRLYEIWMKTGSPRAHGLLKQLGVQPIMAGGARREH